MTPEREAEIPAAAPLTDAERSALRSLADWYTVKGANVVGGDGELISRILADHARLLAALDEARAERDAAVRERDEARADAEAWRNEQREIAEDWKASGDWLAENERIRALPEAERLAAIDDAKARGVFDDLDLDYDEARKRAALMPAFVRAVQQRRDAERERDEARAREHGPCDQIRLAQAVEERDAALRERDETSAFADAQEEAHRRAHDATERERDEARKALAFIEQVERDRQAAHEAMCDRSVRDQARAEQAEARLAELRVDGALVGNVDVPHVEHRVRVETLREVAALVRDESGASVETIAGYRTLLVERLRARVAFAEANAGDVPDWLAAATRAATRAEQAEAREAALREAVEAAQDQIGGQGAYDDSDVEVLDLCRAALADPSPRVAVLLAAVEVAEAEHRLRSRLYGDDVAEDVAGLSRAALARYEAAVKAAKEGT